MIKRRFYSAGGVCAAVLLASNIGLAQTTSPSLDPDAPGADPDSIGPVVDVVTPQLNAPLDDNNLTTPMPVVDLPGPIGGVVGPQAHVGRVWITPVLFEKRSRASGKVDGGVTVRVRPAGSGGSGAGGQSAAQIGNADDEAATRAQLQQQLAAQQQDASGKSGAQSIDQVKQQEAQEKRMCERRARNAWERFTGFFGAKHTEECPSSARRREAVRVGAMNDASSENTLYFINLSRENPATVQVVCRVRAESTVHVANISVAPLEIGEWKPPCACDEDYKFWCRVSSDEEIAAHAIQERKSAAIETREYLSFFLGE